MGALRVGVLAEGNGEHRVALTPEVLARLAGSGAKVLIESGAGAAAWLPDDAYADAGASVTDAETVLEKAHLLACVGPPDYDRIRSGQTVLGLLRPLLSLPAIAAAAAGGIDVVSIDGLPRTLSRAQAMDALSSQTSVAGYAAVLTAANHFARFFPLMITAAGTAKPAEVLVLGAGVAGLQAIATARRLGAVVRGYDVRPASAGEIRSLGAQVVELNSVATGAGEGGYARALTDHEQAAQRAELAGVISRHDVVITTAQVPGRRPPLMVSADAVAAMKPGSVVLDMGASALGGNVEISRPEDTFVTDNGVTVIGAGNLASRMSTAASAAYARNVAALLLHLAPQGELRIGALLAEEDEIAAGVVIVHNGMVVQPATAALLDQAGRS